MTLYAGTIPPEQLRLAMDTRKAIESARGHIRECNYGLAESALLEALALLPFDTCIGGIVWSALEERTSA